MGVAIWSRYAALNLNSDITPGLKRDALIVRIPSINVLLIAVYHPSFSEVSHGLTNVLGPTLLTFNTLYNLWRKTTWSFLFIAEIRGYLFGFKDSSQIELIFAIIVLDHCVETFLKRFVDIAKLKESD